MPWEDNPKYSNDIPGDEWKSHSMGKEVSEARHNRFSKDLANYEMKELFNEVMDKMLEEYAEWRSRRTFEHQHKVLMLFFQLKRIDPKYQAEINFR